MIDQEIQNYVDEKIREHIHDGNYSQRVELESLFGRIRTVDDGTDLTNILAQTPRDFYEQILIDTSTSTKKLYIYDVLGDTWYSTTIT